MKKVSLSFIVLLIAIFSELGLRFVGIGNFPIYQIDPQIGYIPAPHQSGKFLQKNKWAFNDKSMGVAERFQGSEKLDLLVIGDSLVYGGNPYRQDEKLGPQLQKKLGSSYQVWPVGAPSWGFLNEKEYLERHPEVIAEIDGMIWVFNSGDFQDRSQWWTDATHPRSKPICLGYYVLNKYLLEGNLKSTFPAFLFWVKEPAPFSTKLIDQEIESFGEKMQELKANHFKKRLIVFYPNIMEEELPSNDRYESLSLRLEERAKAAGALFFDLRKSPHWKGSDYRDGIHPTAEGYETMAAEVANQLGRE